MSTIIGWAFLNSKYFRLFWTSKNFALQCTSPPEKKSASSIFFLSFFPESIFPARILCFPQVYFPIDSLFFPANFSNSVYSAAISSCNIIFPIMIIFPFSVACVWKSCQLWVHYCLKFSQRVFSCENILLFVVYFTLQYCFPSSVFIIWGFFISVAYISIALSHSECYVLLFLQKLRYVFLPARMYFISFQCIPRSVSYSSNDYFPSEYLSPVDHFPILSILIYCCQQVSCEKIITLAKSFPLLP